MVEAYWQMGKRIVEEEQQGKERAHYSKQLIKILSEESTREFGKGFSFVARQKLIRTDKKVILSTSSFTIIFSNRSYSLT